MEGRPKRRNQRSYAARQHSPHSCRPAADSKVLARGQALQLAEKTNQELTLTNTNLRNQELMHLQTSWAQERCQLMQENRSLQKTLGRKYIHARNEIYRLERALKVAETNKAFGRLENERLQAAFKNEVKAEGKRWRLREENIATELKRMHEKCQEQEVVIMKKEKLISRFQGEMQALTKEHLQTVIEMSQREDAHNESERQWKIKCEALEVRLREETAEREERDKESDSKNKERLPCVQGKKKKKRKN